MDDTALRGWLTTQTCPRCGARGGAFGLSDSYPLSDPPRWVHEATCAACEMRSTDQESPPGSFSWSPLA